MDGQYLTAVFEMRPTKHKAAMPTFFNHIIFVAIFLTFFQCGYGNSSEKLTFESYTPDSLIDIRSNKWKKGKVEISGRLYVPEGQQPFPAVIIVHGSSHVNNMDGWISSLTASLNKQNIAAFILDSYTGRNIYSTASDQSILSKAARVTDAGMALNLLRSDSRIKPNKIGITGYSFGGVVALHVIERKVIERLSSKGVRFAASLPVYPSCQAYWKNPTPTSSPLLILAGQNDNWTKAIYCEDLVKKLKSEGHKASIKVYPKAHHGWIIRSNSAYLPDAWEFNDCGAGWIDDDGYTHAISGDISTKEMSWSDFVYKLVNECASQGVTVEFQSDAQEDTLKTSVDFFKTHFK